MQKIFNVLVAAVVARRQQDTPNHEDSWAINSYCGTSSNYIERSDYFEAMSDFYGLGICEHWCKDTAAAHSSHEFCCTLTKYSDPVRIKCTLHRDSNGLVEYPTYYPYSN